MVYKGAEGWGGGGDLPNAHRRFYHGVEAVAMKVRYTAQHQPFGLDKEIKPRRTLESLSSRQAAHGTEASNPFPFCHVTEGGTGRMAWFGVFCEKCLPAS